MRPLRVPFRLILTLALAIPSLLAAQTPATGSPATDPPGLVVTPAWLAERLTDPSVIVLHVAHENDYEQGHVPGARKLDYGTLVTRRGTVTSELRDADELRATFEGFGVSDGSTVVVYAHEAPMATRALFTLASLGIERFAYLDGGLTAWRAGGHALSRTAPSVTRGRLTPAPAASLVVTAEWLQPRLSGAGVSLIDTRTDGEYVGTGNRSGMPSAGHLAGARQLEWQELFSDGMITLKPREELARLFGERVTAGDTVVTYCWVGYRASTTWFVARLLGYDARLYDGSYQDWSQRRLPTTPGKVP